MASRLTSTTIATSITPSPFNACARPGSVPAGRHLAAIQPADFEYRRRLAAVFHRELDLDDLGLACQPPQAAVVGDEHGDGLVGIRTVRGHPTRRLVIHRHRDLAAAVAGLGEI